jgi:hypothetical protein
MKASQKDMSSSADSRRKREQLQEDKELRQIMGATGNAPATGTSSTGVKPIKLTPKPGFKLLSTTTASGGGAWKSMGVAPKKSEAELHWGNNGEDPYDPVYPTPT